MSVKEYWRDVHTKYQQTDWIDKPSLFAQEAIEYFPSAGRILELAAGQCQDGIFFASRGYSVIATDLTDQALKTAQQRTITESLTGKISFQELDLSQPLPFSDGSFQVVYSHLGLHYFNDQTTSGIFSEIHRVLSPEGIIAILVNTVEDPEANEGTVIEENFIELPNGIRKRYFTVDYMKRKSRQFTPFILDNKGQTYKDKAIGVNNLIRFVGKK